MRIRTVIALAATVSGLCAGTWTCAAQGATVAELESTVEALRERNQALEKSLAEANRAEKEAREQLDRVKLRMEALGRNLLDGGDERLVQAVAEQQILSGRVSGLEGAAARLRDVITDYLRKAVAADPDSRLRVETAIRELDSLLGTGQKPAPETAGSASNAKVMNVDSESGLLVLNVGEAQGARIGTTYQLVRGDQPFGTAIVADVRRNVCGAFVEQLDAGAEPVRLGETAILMTQPGR
jgi:chromosome segregation ATPase